MTDEELFRRYRAGTRPAPRWRRWLWMGFFLLFISTLIGFAVWLMSADQAPLWSLVPGACLGLGCGLVLSCSGFNLPRSRFKRFLYFFFICMALSATKELTIWAIPQHPVGRVFTLAYHLSFGGGLALGLLPFLLPSRSRPLPVTSEHF